MVLAVVDDLLFSSKIRAVAERVGRPVTFLRSRAVVLPEIRARKPDLVIVDLDRDALDPIATIRDVRSQRDLDTVKIVGFVSHVHTATIDAAKRAGIDLVLARSAFVNRLPDLLAPVRDRANEP